MNKSHRHYLFLGMFLLIIPLKPAAWFSTPDSNGYIIVTLKDDLGRPTGMMVGVCDTLKGGLAMIPGGIGEYTLEIPSGYYYVDAPLSPYQRFFTDWFYVSAGDTVKFDHQFESQIITDNIWPLFTQERLDKLILQFSDSENHNLDGLSLYSNRSLIRETRVSDDMYEAYVDTRYPDINWNLPFLADRSAHFPYRAHFTDTTAILNLSIPNNPVIDLLLSIISTQDPAVIASISDDEWVSPVYTMQRTLINPADWGHENLDKFGYVDGRAYFDRTENGEKWRIILAFHRKVVVLSEDSEHKEYHLEAPMSRVVFSPGGRYLFYFDASESLINEDTPILLNTLTGENVRFQQLSEENLDSEHIAAFSTLTPGVPVLSWWTHHPADDGTLVSLYDDSLKYFNEQLELTSICSYDGALLCDRVHGGIRLRSSDGSRFFVIDFSADDCRLLQISRDGSIKYREPIHIGSFKADTALTVLASTRNSNGISVWDLADGSLRWHLDADQCGGIVVSPGGNLIGWSSGCANYEIRSAATGELIDSFAFSSDSIYQVWFSALGDDGTSILDMNSLSGYRIALRSNSGELVWLRALRNPRCSNGWTGGSRLSFSSFRDLHALSSDGKRYIYNDGYFIHVMSFERIAK